LWPKEKARKNGLKLCHIMAARILHELPELSVDFTSGSLVDRVQKHSHGFGSIGISRDVPRIQAPNRQWYNPYCLVNLNYSFISLKLLNNQI